MNEYYYTMNLSQFERDLSELQNLETPPSHYLGAGVSGYTFKATEEGRSSCIKVVPRKTAQSHDDFTQRTLNEVSMLAECKGHENVLELLAYDMNDPKMHYIQTELCECSLYDFLTKSRWKSHMSAMWNDAEYGISHEKTPAGLPFKWSCLYAGQILEGLCDIHSHGITHGDVKTGNCLRYLTPDGYEIIKVADFGLAQKQGIFRTRLFANMPEGTHIAPEQYLAYYLNRERSVFGSTNVGRDEYRRIVATLGVNIAHYCHITQKIDTWAFAISFAHMLIGGDYSPVSKNEVIYQEALNYRGFDYVPTYEKIIAKLPSYLKKIHYYKEAGDRTTMTSYYGSLCKFFKAALAHNPAERPTAAELFDNFPDLFIDSMDDLVIDEGVDLTMDTHTGPHTPSSSTEDDLAMAQEEDPPQAADASNCSSDNSFPGDIFSTFLRNDEQRFIQFFKWYQTFYDEYIWIKLPSFRSFSKSRFFSACFSKGARSLSWIRGSTYGGRTDRFRWSVRLTPAINHWRFN
jgi:serine/threonine protein kinase